MTEYIIFYNSAKNAEVKVDILEGCREHNDYSALYAYWSTYDKFTTRKEAENRLALLRSTHSVGKFVLLRITKEIELLDS